MTNKTAIGILAFGAIFASCSNSENNWDAAGAFESVETIVSTEANGTLMQFDIEEGQTRKPGDWIGYVDSAQLFFAKEELQAQLASNPISRCRLQPYIHNWPMQKKTWKEYKTW
jgi:HlyD family secretion protein